MNMHANTDREQLHKDGYVLLRGAIPPQWLPDLRATFDAQIKPSDQWPVPRGWDWRHSMLDCEPQIQAICRLPNVLAAVGELIGERFFLTQVEGREPVAGGGHQQLHRDMSNRRPGDTVSAIAFFDDYGPENGATRIVPGSHRPEPGAAASDCGDESGAVQLSGRAGDVLVFDVDLLHGASLNVGGGRRRSILIGYAAQVLYEVYLTTAGLRNVRMEMGEWFEGKGV